MAYDPANLSSTPAGYQTPEQIKQLSEYDKALTKGATRDETITSPWQGVRMMADALAGGYLRNKMGPLEMASRQHDEPRSLSGPYSQEPYFPTQMFPQPSNPAVSQMPRQPGVQYPGITGSGIPAFTGQPSMPGGVGNPFMTALMTPPP